MAQQPTYDDLAAENVKLRTEIARLAHQVESRDAEIQLLRRRKPLALDPKAADPFRRPAYAR